MHSLRCRGDMVSPVPPFSLPASTRRQPAAPVRPLRLGAIPRRRSLLWLVPMHTGGLPQIGQLAQTIAGTSAHCWALHSCRIRALPREWIEGERLFDGKRHKSMCRKRDKTPRADSLVSFPFVCRIHSALKHLTWQQASSQHLYR